MPTFTLKNIKKQSQAQLNQCVDENWLMEDPSVLDWTSFYRIYLICTSNIRSHQVATRFATSTPSIKRLSAGRLSIVRLCAQIYADFDSRSQVVKLRIRFDLITSDTGRNKLLYCPCGRIARWSARGNLESLSASVTRTATRPALHVNYAIAQQ